MHPCTIVVAELVPEVNQVNIADLFANRVAADLVMAVVEVAVKNNRDVLTDTILAVVHPCTFVVAGLVPIGVEELVSVEVAVEHNKSRQTNTVLAVVDGSTIVVAELVPEVNQVDIADLFANRVTADLVMAVVVVAVE